MQVTRPSDARVALGGGGGDNVLCVGKVSGAIQAE
jgi:hypothetical protein